MRKMLACLSVAASIIFLLVHGPAQAGPEDATALSRQAVEAARAGNLPEAITLATKAIELASKETGPRMLRGQLYEIQGDYAKAIADYGEVIKLSPRTANAWQQRGEAHFKAGMIAESIADFDEFLKLAPEQKPHHWQRGISLYYAGRFAEGQQQFELHQTVNTQDVENAVWHFLCATRAEGLAAAKRKLIPIEGDPRVPMAEVHRLFAGEAMPEDVLAAAKAAPAKTRAGEPMFYAHLYLGLYFEALGEEARAREHLFKAAERSKENGYMGDVARVHAALLRKKRSK